MVRGVSFVSLVAILAIVLLAVCQVSMGDSPASGEEPGSSCREIRIMHAGEGSEYVSPSGYAYDTTGRLVKIVDCGDE